MPQPRVGLNVAVSRDAMAVPQRFFATLRTWMPEAVLEQGANWRLEWTGTLSIEVRWHAQVDVSLGPWSERFEHDDVDELYDLIAAAVFGRARVITLAIDACPIGTRLEILVGERWAQVPAPSVRKPWRAWFRKPSETVLCNERAAPEDLRWGEPGQLPSAPWVGMLATDCAEPGTLPIDGELDLHPFKPKEVRNVVLAYLDACRERGITEVRLVHGKGIGNLRRTVHALLDRHEAVAGYRLGGMGEGGWGATIVDLRPIVTDG